MALFLDIGQFELSTRRGAPMGRSAAFIPEGADATRGALLACGEGLPDRAEPEQAARTAITMLGDNYIGAIQSFPPQQGLEQSLFAAHRAVVTNSGGRGAAVVTALAFFGRRWILGHAGNARAWLCRELTLKQLSRDHVVPRPVQRPEITRACGIGEELDAEYDNDALAQGDVYAITSPGIHDALSSPVILGILQSDNTAQQMAEALVRRAAEARASGYLGACVARVERLPSEPSAEASGNITSLPVIAAPAIGDTIDGFAIEKIIHTSRRFRLYKALDAETNGPVVLRFPNPSYYNDPKNTQTFLREEWIGRRIQSPHILRTTTLRPGRRTALYSIMEFQEGENLAKRIHRKGGLPPNDAFRYGEQLLAALETLHGQGVLHRDVRANNVIYDKNADEVRLLGLGASRIEALNDHDTELTTSALSYWAPELLKNATASVSTDLYAVGVTIYHMLTDAYPYGKIRTPQEVGQRQYAPVGHYKPGLPSSLDQLLRRACAADPRDRFSSAEQFMSAVISLRTGLANLDTASRETQPQRRSWQPWLITGALLASLFFYLYIALKK